MSNLKPCPFCGSSDVHREGFHWAVCLKCEARAKKWNTRAPDPALAELEKWLIWLKKQQAFIGGFELVNDVLAKLRELKSGSHG